MASNVYPDPNGPNPAFATLLSVREFYDRMVTWVCIPCGIGDAAFVQPRCPRCRQLMVTTDR